MRLMTGHVTALHWPVAFLIFRCATKTPRLAALEQFLRPISILPFDAREFLQVPALYWVNWHA